MKASVIVSVLVATFAIVGMVVAFMATASPYVTIAEAKTGDRAVHVAANLEKNSIQTNLKTGRKSFVISDETGNKLPVVCMGTPPANLESADKVVVVGKVANSTFEASKVLVKCPSKYEGQEN